MKFIINTLSLILISAFAGFAQTSDNKPATSEKPAIVYFYSLKTLPTIAPVKKPVFLDERKIAHIRPARFFIVTLPPGAHNFRLKDRKYGIIEMEFEAGKIYYIKMGWQADTVLHPSEVVLMPTDSGANDIKQLEPIDEKNIADKSLVTRTIKE